MALTVTTAAVSQRLTRKEKVKAELGITGTDDDALFDDLIDEASSAIVSFCRRPFAREVLTETVPGYGDFLLKLERTPIISVSSVTKDSGIITDYSIDDAGAGTLYRRGGWAWSVQSIAGLSGWQRWPGRGLPLPRQEEPLFAVAYTAGYLLPQQNRLSGTVSVASADNSFNDSALLFPSLLVAGDTVQGIGWTAEANNQVGTVVSATAGKIIVSGITLVNEAAAATKGLLVQSIPRDVEKAAIEAVKTWYAGRGDDSNVAEKQVGAMRIRFDRGASVSELTGGVVGSGLPAMCVGLLSSYVRAA